jgi:O-antigen ligase/tetratricopeptide (TPR) repeat protein
MNKTNNSICEFLKYAIIGLVFLVPFSDLIISESLYFPFITGKGFVARAIIIVIALLYTSLVIRDKSYLPKKSPIVWSATAFITVLLVATINSVDPWRSFWSNQERMEGFATLLEMFVLFISTAGVFGNVFAQKAKEKNLVGVWPSEFGVWKWFLNTMLALSVVMGIYAFSQMKTADERIIGTLGNSSYLGGYALVHFFLAMYVAIDVINRLMFSFRKIPAKMRENTIFADAILFVLYVAVGVFNLAVVYQTGTRGSFVGLLVGLFITAIIWAIAEKKLPLFRWIGIISIIIVLGVIAFLGSNKEADFVKKNYLVDRFAQLITWDISKVLSTQGYSRTMIWGMSYEGVKEKPILGWGQDNFSYVFSKYYDPSMYAQEQWFDRTHNVFFDWLIAAGFLGLLAYLILFVSAIYTLWKKTDDNWSVTERAILTGMLIAYFVHNFFVFDNLASYIFFFTILAFINTRGQGGRVLVRKPLVGNDYVWFVDGAVFLILAYVMWIAVLSPYNSSGNLIKAMQDKQRVLVDNKEQVVSTDPKARFKLIKGILEANDLTRSESRERLVDIAASIILQVNKTDPTFAKEVFDYTVDQYEKETASAKNDPRPYFFKTIFFQKLGIMDKALESIDKAIALSPTKQSFLFTKGQLLLTLNRKDESNMTFQKAYELDKTNPEALKYYSYSLIENNKIKEIDPILDEHIKINPTFKRETIWNDPAILQALINVKAFSKAISLAKQKVAENPYDIQALISLSAVYLKSGDKWSSIEELKKIKKLEPSYSADVDKYIQDIKDGKDPSAQNAN